MKTCFRLIKASMKNRNSCKKKTKKIHKRMSLRTNQFRKISDNLKILIILENGKIKKDMEKGSKLGIPANHILGIEMLIAQKAKELFNMKMEINI